MNYCKIYHELVKEGLIWNDEYKERIIKMFYYDIWIFWDLDFENHYPTSSDLYKIDFLFNLCKV